MVQKGLIEGHSWGDQFSYTAFDEFVLYQFRVLELVAYGHLVPGADEFREVVVYCVVRKPGHRNLPRISVLPGSEDQSKYLARQDGVVGICFVEIPDPVQQDCLGVLSLHLEELPYHRSVFSFLLHVPTKL